MLKFCVGWYVHENEKKEYDDSVESVASFMVDSGQCFVGITMAIVAFID